MSGKKGGQKGGDKKGGEEFKFNFNADQKGVQSVLDLAGKDAAVVQHFQKKLGTLVGASSGYLESLPNSVQQRVKALKHLHTQRRSLEEKYEEELLQLEKKYDALFQPLIDRRQDIVSGASEPKAEELVEDKKEQPKEGEAKTEQKGEDNVKGIPDFWLHTLLHHDAFSSMITERDQEALKHLTNIKIASVADSPHSFSIEFHFTANEFFDNDVLKKTYILNKNPEDGEIMYDHVDCTEIKWKTGKNLTVKKVQKKPKKKKGKKGGQPAAPITVEEPCESFFNFFNPEAAYPLYAQFGGFGEEDEDEEDEENFGLQEFLEDDYEMGLELKDKIVPHAVQFFTGEYDTGMMFEGEDDEEDDEDQEDEEEYDEEKDTDYKPPAEGQQQQPECKQQ